MQRGEFLNEAANALVRGVAPEFESSEQQQDSTFGVDSHEITEHHLQAALSSHQVGSAGQASAQKYHIPTPKSVEVLSQSQYNEQYPSNAYSDPVTYVRFSDTVEYCNRGSPYCMDEDDKGWLDKRNEKAQDNLANALKEIASDAGRPDSAQIEALLIKDPSKYRFISEDEFETIMYVFERTTCDRHPLLELDLSKLPPLSELLPQFEPDSLCSTLALPELPVQPNDLSIITSNLTSKPHNYNKPSPTVNMSSQELKWSAENPFRHLFLLKPCAYAVYDWWKLRRQAREGRPIVPSLNSDESNENDPYVCFRRREVKSARKTRKTDTLQLEKLVRLESELGQAKSLFFMVAQRERLKEREISEAKECWAHAHELMTLKRRWSITGPDKGHEDESLFFGIQPDPTAPIHSSAALQNTQLMKKKRKADEISSPSAVTSTTLKLRRPKSETESTSNAKAVSDNSALKSSSLMERTTAMQQYIDRECTLRQQVDAGVEDLTDTAFQPVVAPPALRAFRPIQSDNHDTHFWSNHPFARPGRQSCFRRRIGRGGRIFLDRRPIAVSPAPANIGAWPRQRQNGFPLATFGFDRSFDPMKRADATGRILGATDSFRYHTPLIHSARVAPMLLPTPDLSWDPLNSKDPRAPLTHNPDLQFKCLSKNGAYHVPQGTDDASVSSDSTDHTHMTDDTADGQSTQATDLDQDEEAMKEDKDGAYVARKRDLNVEEESVEEQMERAQKLAERWRYNEDGGRYAGLGLLGLGGMEGDEEAVLDDYDQRFIRYRMSLLDETNLLKLSTDWTYMRQALIAASSNAQSKPTIAVGTDNAKNANSAEAPTGRMSESMNAASPLSSDTKETSTKSN